MALEDSEASQDTTVAMEEASEDTLYTETASVGSIMDMDMEGGILGLQFPWPELHSLDVHRLHIMVPLDSPSHSPHRAAAFVSDFVIKQLDKLKLIQILPS